MFFLQALTLMDMSTTNPKTTFSVSADLKLIDATGRPFSISIDYAGSLKVSTVHYASVLYTNVIRALKICLAISSSRATAIYQRKISRRSHSHPFYRRGDVRPLRGYRWRSDSGYWRSGVREKSRAKYQICDEGGIDSGSQEGWCYEEEVLQHIYVPPLQEGNKSWKKIHHSHWLVYSAHLELWSLLLTCCTPPSANDQCGARFQGTDIARGESVDKDADQDVELWLIRNIHIKQFVRLL